MFAADEPRGMSPRASTLTTRSEVPTHPAADLFVVSFLMLFFELAAIRWLPAAIHVVAYFSNLVLISCFLGMGLGCIYRGKRDLFATFPPVALTLVLLSSHLGSSGVALPYQAVEFIFGPSGQHSWLWVLPLVFTLNALAFVGIGQRLGQLMDSYPALRGYTLNVAGSLAGTLVFALFAFLRLPPSSWFAVCLLLAGWLLRRGRGLVVGVASLLLATGLVWQQERGFLWSPYYKIRVEQSKKLPPGAYGVTVNDDYHQLVLNLSPSLVARSDDLESWARTYDLPYILLPAGRRPEVLALGAGTGNDVAAALRNGASRVDAVELDPVIVDLGRKLHAEHPYQDPRVHTIVADARTVLAAGHARYDLIVMGWLDSHRLFSSLSNVRQDNFVYTVEAMRQAKAMLREDGLLALSFYVGKAWVGEKIFAMLRTAFGHDPEVFALADGGFGPPGQIFVIGPRIAKHQAPKDILDLTSRYDRASLAPAPTDGWPYLYYRDRELSWEYLASSAIVLAISALLVGAVGRGPGLVFAEAAQFFFLGAGFLLLEVRNITVLALSFGSTWVVSSVVIAAVLVMILIANSLVARGIGARHARLLWPALVVTIVASLLGTRVGAAGGSHAVNAALATAAVSLSFLVAGVVFATVFARTRVPSAALGYNVLGAVAGGLSEYFSILVGIDGLAWLAIGFYLLAWLSSRQAALVPAAPSR